ncbi:phosphatidate cytidylyltransferase [Desulfurobacterium thermolithotrophum]|uniref:phosphatidate cytidylyltransferase n=1 Tax=Desulfurobacterium thermolithotrophum TaxID=64160 RepID=UPI0013D6A03F|nr:phosphatidate cytidylyltransferase [Desulfurobacterium thermolithotrophum]
MKQRVIGAFFVILYAVFMIISPYKFYVSLVYLLGVGMISELSNFTGLKDSKTPIVVIFSILFFVGIYISHLSFLLPTAAIIFLFGYFIIIEGKVPNKFLAIAGFFVYLLIGVIAIGKLSKGYFVLLLSIVWSVDTFAYLVGKYFGKRKLIPEISPKKTVEGAIGGAIGGVVVSLIIGKYLGIFEVSLLTAFSLFVLTIISQIGDLIESYIKRVFGVKDSGTIIPGHGGLLDRLDSSIAVAPFLVVFGGLQ